MPLPSGDLSCCFYLFIPDSGRFLFCAAGTEEVFSFLAVEGLIAVFVVVLLRAGFKSEEACLSVA